MERHTDLVYSGDEALHRRVILGRWKEVVESWSSNDARHYTLNTMLDSLQCPAPFGYL